MCPRNRRTRPRPQPPKTFPRWGPHLDFEVGDPTNPNPPLSLHHKIRVPHPFGRRGERMGGKPRTPTVPSQPSNAMGAPHLDSEMWESTNPNPPALYQGATGEPTQCVGRAPQLSPQIRLLRNQVATRLCNKGTASAGPQSNEGRRVGFSPCCFGLPAMNAIDEFRNSLPNARDFRPLNHECVVIPSQAESLP
jgi:hypothetical protein